MLLKAFFEHDSKANLAWLEEPKIHDLPYPSCLILGYRGPDRALHVVCAPDAAGEELQQTLRLKKKISN